MTMTKNKYIFKQNQKYKYKYKYIQEIRNTYIHVVFSSSRVLAKSSVTGLLTLLAPSLHCFDPNIDQPLTNLWPNLWPTFDPPISLMNKLIWKSQFESKLTKFIQQSFTFILLRYKLWKFIQKQCPVCVHQTLFKHAESGLVWILRPGRVYNTSKVDWQRCKNAKMHYKTLTCLLCKPWLLAE